MSKITDFTKLGKAGYSPLAADILKALKSVEEKYGIKFEWRGARHTESQSDLKISAALVAGDGQVIDRKADDFKVYAKMVGLSPDDLGREVRIDGEDFTIVGMNVSKPKNQISIKRNKDGKPFATSVDNIKKCFAVIERASTIIKQNA